jgi:hypothetical protein
MWHYKKIKKTRIMRELKGKNTFTMSEIKKIEELIRLRNNTPASGQKNIRQKMRNIGFYGQDDWGITNLQLDDLHRLIKNKEIIVIGTNSTTTISETTTTKHKVVEVQTPKQKSTLKSHTTDLKSILDEFKRNCFDPKVDLETKIPDFSGNYILCLRKNSMLPTTTSLKLNQLEGLDVFYTGIAGSSLRTRDYKQHFKGNNAGRSTLRKSIGVLFGYKLIPRDKDPNTGKTKFGIEDEIKLSEWMHKNLIMYFLPTSDFNQIEIKLIEYFNPPLNLKDNKNIINADFRTQLSNLRNNRNN